jgi:hypothetical protein
MVGTEFSLLQPLRTFLPSTSTTTPFCNNGGYGVNDGAGGSNFTDQQINTLHNHFYGNTSNPTSLGATLPDFESIDGDPLFTDSVNMDYTLQSGSPLVGAGMNGSTIGALGLASAGGGGGGGGVLIGGRLVR